MIGVGRQETYKRLTHFKFWPWITSRLYRDRLKEIHSCLLWVDLFSGYVLAKASSSRTAQTIAEKYEECVFRRFGEIEAIRYDQEPGLMSDFFRAFNKIAGQKQRATYGFSTSIKRNRRAYGSNSDTID